MQPICIVEDDQQVFPLANYFLNALICQGNFFRTKYSRTSSRTPTNMTGACLAWSKSDSAQNDNFDKLSLGYCTSLTRSKTKQYNPFFVKKRWCNEWNTSCPPKSHSARMTELIWTVPSFLSSNTSCFRFSRRMCSLSSIFLFLNSGLASSSVVTVILSFSKAPCRFSSETFSTGRWGIQIRAVLLAVALKSWASQCLPFPLVIFYHWFTSTFDNSTWCSAFTTS